MRDGAHADHPPPLPQYSGCGDTHQTGHAGRRRSRQLPAADDDGGGARDAGADHPPSPCYNADAAGDAGTTLPPCDDAGGEAGAT